MNNIIITKLRQNTYKKIINEHVKHYEEEYDEEIDITKYLKFGKFNEIIEVFSDTFDEKIGLSRKRMFDTNIKKLKIYELPKKNISLKNIRTTGLYNPRYNKIKIYGNNDDINELSEKLMHELLHMSSRKAREYISGLEMATPAKGGYLVAGRGLDEGYTELLNSRYFAMQKHTNSYAKEKILAAGIEKIVGKEKMLDYYFEYTLLDLINNLNQYNGDKKYYYDLIHNIDILTPEMDNNIRCELFNDVKNRIIKTHKNKIESDLKNKKIDIQEYNRQNFFNIKMYEKYDFIYDEDARLVDQNDKYLLFGDMGFIKLDKNDADVKEYMKVKNR